MGNVGNVGFFEKYSCASFFKKIWSKCFTYDDVRSMADEYEENILKVSNDCDKEIRDVKELSKKTHDELNNKIDELQTNIKDMIELHNRTNVSKEKTIDDLIVKIDKLKQEIRDKDKYHSDAINKLVVENSSKLNRIKTECADALLKADKKNNKTSKVKVEDVIEDTTAEVIPELPVLEEEAVVKKRKARSGVSALTKEQIEEIKLRKEKGEKSSDLALVYGVHKATIDRAVKK